MRDAVPYKRKGRSQGKPLLETELLGALSFLKASISLIYTHGTEDHNASLIVLLGTEGSGQGQACLRGPGLRCLTP